MNKLTKIFTSIIIFFLIFFLFKYNLIIKTSVIEAFDLWLQKIFPSLFIMFILNDIIIKTNLLKPINNLFNPLFNKLFNTTGESFEVFLLSLISGTPSSAFIINESRQNNNITLEDANKLIAFTYFANPLFLYNILSLSFNSFITFKIIIIYYFSNILIGLLFRNKKDTKNIINENKKEVTNNNSNIINILPTAINKSFNTLLIILGTIIFYHVITNLLINIIHLKGIFNIIIQGIIEITQSLNNLPTLNILSIKKEILAIAIISFGGLSIHTQILSLINNTNIKYQNFFKGRIYHVLISTITYIFISYWINC